jgi:hypothetical protein
MRGAALVRDPEELANRLLVRKQVFGEALDPKNRNQPPPNKVHLDRKLERMLATLLRLKVLRQGTIVG